MSPQSWNRCAYVGGNPLANVDPDGLVTLPGCEEGDWGCGLGGGGWGCGALGGPEGDLCTLMLPPPSVRGGNGGGSGSGGSGGGGTSAGSGGGTGSGGAGGRIANFPNGESLGIPPGVSANWGGIWGALLPIDPSCEFGPCLGGTGFLGGANDPSGFFRDGFLSLLEQINPFAGLGTVVHCVAGELIPGVTKKTSEEGVGTAAEELGPKVWYRVTDGRFARWGKYSEVLVPRAAARVAKVTRPISEVGDVVLGLEVLHAGYKCLE